MKNTFLITGANRGIGLAITQELLEKGHRVFAGTRHPDDSPDLDSLAGAHGEKLVLLPLDITSDESVQAAAGRVDSLDVLINNAGAFPEEGNETLTEMDLRHFHEAFDVNVVGTARVTRTFLSLLEKGERPRIINVSSGAGSIADKDDYGYYAYSASKAALNMLTRAMAAEFKPRGICVVALTPGWVRTRMGGDHAPLAPEESGSAIAQTALNLSMAMTGKFIDREGRETEYGW